MHHASGKVSSPALVSPGREQLALSAFLHNTAITLPQYFFSAPLAKVVRNRYTSVCLQQQQCQVEKQHCYERCQYYLRPSKNHAPSNHNTTSIANATPSTPRPIPTSTLFPFSIRRLPNAIYPAPPPKIYCIPSPLTASTSQQNIIFPHSTLPLLTTPSSKSDLLTQSLCVTVHIHVQRLNLHREQFGCSITTLLAMWLNGDGQVPPNSKSVMRAHVNNSMLPLRMRQYPGDDGVQLRHNHNVT